MICELENPSAAYAVVADSRDMPRPLGAFSIGPEGGFMFRTQIGPDILADDMAEYLNDRAQELGVSFWDAYCEEMEAKRELQQITPSNATLLEIAKTSGPPPGLADDPEERPW